MAILGYNQIIKQAKPSSAATTLTPPKRQLSFQGRLTDSAGTPIFTAVNLNFKLWDQLSAGTEGSCTSAGGEDCLYKTGTCSITPDTDGIFNSLIGDTVCGAEIPQSVFLIIESLFRSYRRGGDPHPQTANCHRRLCPQLRNPPGVSRRQSATINTIPVVDNSGNINISAASPSIISSSGNLISRPISSLTTATSSGGDIVLQPDALGSGQI